MNFNTINIDYVFNLRSRLFSIGSVQNPSIVNSMGFIAWLGPGIVLIEKMMDHLFDPKHEL